MEPEMTSKALEPVKGNLTVGSTGIDHSGPNFSEREYVVLTLNNIDRMGYFPASKPQAGDRIRVQYLDNGEKRDWPLEPKQKQHNSAMAERLAQAKKIPGWLTEDRISWTSNFPAHRTRPGLFGQPTQGRQQDSAYEFPLGSPQTRVRFCHITRCGPYSQPHTFGKSRCFRHRGRKSE